MAKARFMTKIEADDDSPKVRVWVESDDDGDVSILVSNDGDGSYHSQVIAYLSGADGKLHLSDELSVEGLSLDAQGRIQVVK